jgi:hypothetical protein
VPELGRIKELLESDSTELESSTFFRNRASRNFMESGSGLMGIRQELQSPRLHYIVGFGFGFGFENSEFGFRVFGFKYISQDSDLDSNSRLMDSDSRFGF